MNDFGYALAVGKDGATLMMNDPQGNVFNLPLDREDITAVIALLQHALTLQDRCKEEDAAQ